MGSMSYTQFLFSFDGRISRSAYWLKWILPFYAILIAFGIVGNLLSEGAAGRDSLAAASQMGPAETMAMILCFVFLLASIWPGLAIAAKRWHDRGKSGWWTLIALVPIIGGFWMLIECGFLKGTAGPNRFGDDPLRSGGYQPAMEPQI